MRKEADEKKIAWWNIFSDLYIAAIDLESIRDEQLAYHGKH